MDFVCDLVEAASSPALLLAELTNDESSNLIKSLLHL
jgi:hypothetical protein